MCIESWVESMTLIYLLAIKPLTAIEHSLLNSGSAGGQSRSRQYLALRDRKNDFGLQAFGDGDFDDDSVAAVRKLTGKRPNETSSASERPNGRSLTCYSHDQVKLLVLPSSAPIAPAAKLTCFRRFLL